MSLSEAEVEKLLKSHVARMSRCQDAGEEAVAIGLHMSDHSIPTWRHNRIQSEKMLHSHKTQGPPSHSFLSNDYQPILVRTMKVIRHNGAPSADGL